MAFVPVPKDLNRVKTKVMFNLTKRQLICFSIAAAVGVPIFFLAKAHLDLSTAAMLMVVIMLPFIFFALYEKDGQPAEKYLYHIVQSMFIRDKVRTAGDNPFGGGVGGGVKVTPICFLIVKDGNVRMMIKSAKTYILPLSS